MAGGSVCQSCGSLLPLPDTEGNVSCLSCGRAERARAKEPDPPTGSASGASVGASSGTVFVSWSPEGAGGGGAPSTGSRGAGRAIGCILGVALIVGIIPVVLAAGLFAGRSSVDDAVEGLTSGGGRRSLSPAGYEAVALPLADGAATEVITVAYDGQKDSRFVARAVLGGDGGGGWESEPFPSGVTSARLLLSGRTVFAVVGEQLWAVVADTGVVSWKAPLSDVVQAGCHSCFVALGDGVVLETADGQVLAFGPGSASPLWVHRLAATNSPLAISGAGVVVSDDVPDDPGRRQVVVLDPATGAVVSAFAPECGDGSLPREFGFADEFYAVEGSTDLVATISFGGGCAVRWNGANGQPSWATPVEVSVSSDRGLVAADRLYLGSTSGVTEIDLVSGIAVTMAAPPDTTASPLLRVGDLLLAETATTRGSPQAGLAAYDLSTGQVRWSFDLPGKGALLTVNSGTSDALFDEEGRSVVFEAEGRILVATFAGESRTVTTRAVDPASGVLGEPVVAQLPSRPGTPSVTVHFAGARGLLFSIDQKVVHLSPGGEPVSWPGG